MRVAVVTESFLPTINGVTASVVHAVAELNRLGHQTLVIAPAPAPVVDAENEHGVVRVPSVPLPGYPSFRVGLPTPALSVAMRQFSPDVVHLASPAALGAWGVTAARRLRLPTVAVYQTDLPGYVDRYGMTWARPLAKTWLREIHMRASLTLAPSTSTLFALRQAGIPRVRLWGRGVDGQLFSPQRRSAELRRHLAPNGEVIVGFVGRLAPEKQCEDLAALADLPGTRVVVVGDGPSLPALRRRLPEAMFLGFLRGEALARAYASLDVFVHTGASETFGQTLQEAMASGVPVVAPASGGPLDLVMPDLNGALYAPGDLAGLRAAVGAYARDSQARKRHGDAGRRCVARRSWGALVGQLLEHYRSVIPTHAPLEVAA